MDIEKMLTTILEELQDFKRMTNARFDTMEAEFAVMKMDVGTLKSDMTAVKSDIDTMKGDIDTLKGDIASMEMRLGKKIDAAAEDTRSLEVITAKNWRDICALKTLAQS